MDLYRLFFLISIVCCSLTVRAQTAMDDSLSKKVATVRLSSEKAEIYYQAGDDIAIQDTVKAVAYIQKGIQYAKGNPFYEGVGYFYLGRVYMDFSHQKAEKAFDTALQYFQPVITSESYIYQSRTWANKATMSQLSGDNKTFIHLLLEKAIPLAAKGGDSLRVADNYTNISLPFTNYGEYDKAIFYLHKSAALFQRLAPNDLRLVDVYCHLAKIYVLQNKITEAGAQLQLAERVLKQDPTSLYAPNFHTIEAMYLFKLKQWEPAEQTVAKGLAIAEKFKNRYEIRQLLYQKARILDAQQDWAGAKEVLLRMYNEGYVELATDKQQLFQDLAGIENHLGNNQQAYNWMVKHAQISEEIYQQETKAKITELEAKYNYAQKEKELILATAKAKKQRQMVWLTALTAAIALIGLYFWYKNKRARTIQQLKQQQQIELGKALLEGEEKERSRLARDLHDGLGGMLAGIKLNLSQMVATKQQLERHDLNQTIDRLGISVNELRRISRNMMPESLLQSGLQVAIKDLCDESTLPGLKVNFNAFDLQENFAPQVKVMIYRIIQELVNNVVKHAGASKVMVQCSQSDDYFFITVEDNGKGFSLDLVPKTSQGLKNLRSRVALLKGKMDIETSEEGTIINIELYVGQ